MAELRFSGSPVLSAYRLSSVDTLILCLSQQEELTPETDTSTAHA